MKKIFLCFLPLLFLQGCVAGALVGGTAAGVTTVANDNRSLSTISEDERTTYDANQHLLADNELSDKAHVVVATFNHKVLLAGQAPNQALRDKAEQIVKGVPNVQRIYNQIQIDEPTSAMQRSRDAFVTGNVKARMISTTNIKASQFKIVTENGTVYIMGISSKDQANSAVEVARNSTGVKKVVKIIEYTA